MAVVLFTPRCPGMWVITIRLEQGGAVMRLIARQCLKNQCRGWLAALLLACASAAVAAPTTDQLTAAQAYELAQTGKVTLIDIRQPEEWRQTGVAQGVSRISMRQPGGAQGFAQAVYQAAGHDLETPIVLICRTGSRTSRLVPLLKEMGFTNVTDVPEGMLGSRAGPGWIAQGLPIDPCKTC